jgi:DNA-binding CsgD family transcriptional regulator
MARNSDEALTLIGRIYDAAIQSGLWPEALARLAAAVGGTRIVIGIHDLTTRSVAIMAPRMHPADIDNGGDRARRDHDGGPSKRAGLFPAGHALYAERFAPRRALTRGGFHDRWYRALGLGAAGFAVNFHIEQGVPALCGIRRPTREGAFAADEIALFERIAPHLVRAVEVQRRLWRLALARQPACVDTGRDHTGSILIDGAGTVILLDDAAKESLDTGDGLRLEKGRIRAGNGGTSEALDRLIRACASPGQANKAAGTTLTIPLRGKRRPLQAVVSPFHALNRAADLAWLGIPRPAAIVAIADPERAHRIPAERLRTQFGLTRAETALAREIAKGDGRQAAAARLGISVGTARTHLMRVFEKTGVRRQAELVRLLLERRAEPPGSGF